MKTIQTVIHKVLSDRELWTALLMWIVVAGVCVFIANVLAAKAS